MGLENRMISPYVGNEESICEMIFNSPIDFKASDALLEAQRAKSFEWLKNALLSPKKLEVDRAYERIESVTPPQVDGME